ncbi:MAG: hypothetical protein GWM92_13155, partial [Gemmatimonadetes bacterium]|nr:hypothetical protein [Gemmatimonadota bacterium]NIR79653.1 hypothetical protein [Gemmatimonadota bacterium]NIT88349.1 hypothetical protein [Gemmatimonadota bacterium]NIU32162.1 hypothetical protein [Gemmatimonadota bacterium]NIU36725.1 hypothetical protein [Gemmatimonadota bacterium]
SLALLLLGLELATHALSRSVETIGRVVGDLRAGEETEVYLPAFFAGLLLMGVGVGGLLLSGWSRWMGGRLLRGKACPQCGVRTQRIRRRWQRLLGRVLSAEVQRRQCGECGWRGLTRA